MQSKATLRAEIRAKIQALSAQERAQNSALIAQHFLKSPLYRNAQTLFAFASTSREVSTREILEQCLRDGKTLALPHTGRDGSILVFHRVKDLASDLEAGRFGIKEPITTLPVLQNNEANVVLVPGVAFTLKGERLGQGGGYYDRFLETLPTSAIRAALVFDCQMVSALPVEIHDQKVDWLATVDDFKKISD